MASEYTPNRRYPLYTDSDKPNLRDQYNGAIREIDTDMAQALSDSSAVAASLGAGFDAQHTVRMALDNKVSSEALQAEATARTQADTALETSIQAEATARTQADTALGARITALESKWHMIAIGDSYTHVGYGLTAAQMWWNKFAEEMHVTPHVYAANGRGFVSGLSDNTDFNSQLTNAINDTAFDNNKVAYVCVLGAINDSYQTDIDVSGTVYLVRVRNFINRIRENFPNAKIIIGGCNTFAHIRYEGADSIYKRSALEIQRTLQTATLSAKGAVFIPMAHVLCGANAFFAPSSEGGHPNEYGQNAMASAFLNGGLPYAAGAPTFNITHGSGGSVSCVANAGVFNLLINNVTTEEYNSSFRRITLEDEYGLLQFIKPYYFSVATSDSKPLGIFNSSAVDKLFSGRIGAINSSTHYRQIDVYVAGQTDIVLNGTIPIYV